MKIDHLGIAVRNIESALPFYSEMLGLKLAEKETVADQGVHVAMLPVGDSRIELLEPFSEETPVGRFIAKRGEGIHHICYEVENLEQRLAEMSERGIRLLEGYPRKGAGGRLVAFVHPGSAGGVLIELVEKSANAEGE